jgi:hypothetical protein
MGAWEITNFGNDAAIAWVYEFTEDPTMPFIDKALLSVKEDDYLDSDVASTALAAIEVIAAAKGHPSTDFPEQIEPDWLASLTPYIDEELIKACRKLIDRIIDEKNNELFELWKEAGQHKEWVNIQKDLSNRLS